MPTCRRLSAFTLIELLIVVAIIAILAAIAVPNFLEAQIRAKVVRMRADMRSLATAVESYYVDHTNYPGCVDVNTTLTINLTPGELCSPRINALVAFTTPIAYVSSAFSDVFNTMDMPLMPRLSPETERVLVYLGPDFLIEYQGTDLRMRTSVVFSEFSDVVHDTGRVRDPLWVQLSYGPDQDFDPDDGPRETTGMYGNMAVIQPYDPSNGTVSDGDLLRFRE